jgi:hypothetical protein
MASHHWIPGTSQRSPPCRSRTGSACHPQILEHTSDLQTSQHSYNDVHPTEYKEPSRSALTLTLPTSGLCSLCVEFQETSWQTSPHTCYFCSGTCQPELTHTIGGSHNCGQVEDCLMNGSHAKSQSAQFESEDCFRTRLATAPSTGRRLTRFICASNGISSQLHWSIGARRKKSFSERAI